MPIKTFTAGGATLFDSDAVRGGICVGQYFIAAGSSFSKSFPLLQGAVLRGALSYVRYTSTSSYPDLAINNSGSPSVSVSPAGMDRNLLLWASGTPSIVSGAGMQAVASDQTIALSPSGRGLIHLGLASYTTLVPTSSSGINDLGYWWIEVTSATQPVAVVDMSGGILLQSSPVFRNVSGNLWRAYITAVAAQNTFAPPTTLLTPAVHCFSLPTSPSVSPRAAIYDVDGTLAYDLLAGKMLATVASIEIAASELTASTTLSVARSLPAAGTYGLYGGVPYERLKQRAANSALTSHGFWKIAGTTLSAVDSVTTLDTDSGTITPYTRASTARAEIVDLSVY